MRSRLPKFALFNLCVAVATPGYSQSSGQSPPYSCSVDQVSLAGTWRASRDVVETNGSVSPTRDTYEWQPKEVIEFAPGMKLRWEIVYYWPADAGPQKQVSETEILLDMHFAFEAKDGVTLTKPESSWLHFYRSADAAREKHPLATSLSTMTLWHQYGAQRLSTRAIVSLDDLLAFGTGRDTLTWDIRSPPDRFGATTVAATGKLPIANMRGKAAEILKLRKLLDRKAANLRTHCQIRASTPVAVPFPG